MTQEWLVNQIHVYYICNARLKVTIEVTEAYKNHKPCRMFKKDMQFELNYLRSLVNESVIPPFTCDLRTEAGKPVQGCINELILLSCSQRHEMVFSNNCHLVISISYVMFILFPPVSFC